MSLHEVTKICLTGGPCGGKTTALERLRALGEHRGYAVAVAPEMATILIANGFRVRAAETPREAAMYQWFMAKAQVALEDALTGSLTLDHRPGILLCDRGVYDNRAYTSPKEWPIYQKLMGPHLRHSRYDLVFHLETAPAERYVNNAVRTETREQALELDQRTWDAWEGHPHRFRVGNGSCFADKLGLLETLAFAHLPPVPVPA